MCAGLPPLRAPRGSEPWDPSVPGAPELHALGSRGCVHGDTRAPCARGADTPCPQTPGGLGLQGPGIPEGLLLHALGYQPWGQQLHAPGTARTLRCPPLCGAAPGRAEPPLPPGRAGAEAAAHGGAAMSDERLRAVRDRVRPFPDFPEPGVLFRCGRGWAPGWAPGWGWGRTGAISAPC
ncbi:adenine phosphoribosyltransferase isoform X3 [Corvus hawaiiensis]|uniref:adenine phosphoribosyltransferase isoform X3 n=1 Tax=Corvus hawaiiensis TaxID=134902 RepID=UPI0020192856|nr:adenine phosphoribosyltransferase isoform X3 [Corvus hawaiiensis]